MNPPEGEVRCSELLKFSAMQEHLTRRQCFAAHPADCLLRRGGFTVVRTDRRGRGDLIHVERCVVMCSVCSMLYAVCRVLYAVCCMLYAERWTLCAFVRCALCGVRCVLCVVFGCRVQCALCALCACAPWAPCTRQVRCGLGIQLRARVLGRKAYIRALAVLPHRACPASTRLVLTRRSTVLL